MPTGPAPAWVFPLFELAMYGLFLLCLLHAWRKGSGNVAYLLGGLFFGVQYSCKMLGDNDFLPPALAAWAPVLCFGPLAVTMFDAVHT